MKGVHITSVIKTDHLDKQTNEAYYIYICIYIYYRIIKHCRKSLPFQNSKLWIKKTLNNHLFDVTMGSFDGSKVCEQVVLLFSPNNQT